MYFPQPVNIGHLHSCFISFLCLPFPKVHITPHESMTLTLSFMAPSQSVWNKPQTISGFAGGTSHCPHGTRRQPSGCVCVFYIASFALLSHPRHLIDFVEDIHAAPAALLGYSAVGR